MRFEGTIKSWNDDRGFGFIEPQEAGARRGRRAPALQARQQGTAQWGTATLFAIPAFLLLCLAVALAWRPSAWFAAAYCALSALTFIVYAVDKSAARAGGRRTRESTLQRRGVHRAVFAVGAWMAATGRLRVAVRDQMPSPATRASRRLLLAMCLMAPLVVIAERDIDVQLRAATERGDLVAFRALVAAGAAVNARDAQKDSAFLVAARNGHAAIVREAIAAGADLRSLNRYGSTALMGPSYRGHVEVVRVLLATDIDLHHVNDLGWTALLEAIVLGRDGPAHQEIVRMLIARGSDVHRTDRDGISALQHAQRRGQEEVARMLRAGGARL